MYRFTFQLISKSSSLQIFHAYVKRRMVNTGVPLQEVISKLTEYASPSLAESWDNVGLLLEPSFPHHINNIFLTNDLTEQVLDEAIAKSANLIISYHPPIFSSIKRITQDKWKNRLIVKALENRVAIYSPHTTYDVMCLMIQYYASWYYANDIARVCYRSTLIV